MSDKKETKLATLFPLQRDIHKNLKESYDVTSDMFTMGRNPSNSL
jgi:hypothetical protein